MLMGLSYEGGNSPYRLIFLLVDKSGNIEDGFPLYSLLNQSFADGGLALHPDGSVMAASAVQKTATTSQFYTKISTDGAFAPAPNFPKTFDEGTLFVYDMHAALDGSGFAVVGNLNGQAYVLKTDLDGREIFKKTYGDLSDYALGSASTSDGGFILSGGQGFTLSGRAGNCIW